MQVIYFIATFAPASVSLSRVLIVPLYFSASFFFPPSFILALLVWTREKVNKVEKKRREEGALRQGRDG